MIRTFTFFTAGSFFPTYYNYQNSFTKPENLL